MLISIPPPRVITWNSVSSAIHTTPMKTPKRQSQTWIKMKLLNRTFFIGSSESNLLKTLQFPYAHWGIDMNWCCPSKQLMQFVPLWDSLMHGLFASRIALWKQWLLLGYNSRNPSGHGRKSVSGCSPLDFLRNGYWAERLSSHHQPTVHRATWLSTSTDASISFKWDVVTREPLAFLSYILRDGVTGR